MQMWQFSDSTSCYLFTDGRHYFFISPESSLVYVTTWLLLPFNVSYLFFMPGYEQVCIQGIPLHMVGIRTTEIKLFSLEVRMTIPTPLRGI